MTKKKEMTEEERLQKAVELFDKIQKLLPDSYISLLIHDIDIKNLNPEIWEIEANFNPDTKDTYLTAKRKTQESEDYDDRITLFD